MPFASHEVERHALPGGASDSRRAVLRDERAVTDAVRVALDRSRRLVNQQAVRKIRGQALPERAHREQAQQHQRQQRQVVRTAEEEVHLLRKRQRTMYQGTQAVGSRAKCREV